MISQEPPTLIVDPEDGTAVTLYPDHDNPLVYYYLPLAPHATRVAGHPQLQLTKYVSDTDAFALLDFDVNLAITADQQKRLQSKLQRLLALNDTPRITPAQPADGGVSVMLLGVQSDKAGSNQLVKGVYYPASPSLYNDNRAIFSVMLTPAGSDLVEATLKSREEGVMTAVGVIYSLTFDILRPAYAVKAHVDWARVHKSLSEEYQETGVFFGANIAKSVETLNDGRIIKISVDNMLGDADQTSAIQAMMGQIRSMIFDNFFKPALEPAKSKSPSFWDGLLNLGTTAAQASMTGGWSLLAHFQWNREDRTQELKQTMDIDLHERAVVKMKLYPQAHLTDVMRGVDKSVNLVRELNATTGSEFFKKRKLQVDTNLPLDTDGISSIVVDLSYGDRLQSNKFTPAQAGQLPASMSFDWTSQLGAKQKMLRPITSSFKVNFAPRADSTWPTSLTATAEPVTGDFWTVNPRALYGVSTIRFTLARSFDWARYAQVVLHTRYIDARNGINLSRVFNITSQTQASDGSPGVTWTLLQRDPALSRYQYKLSYQLQGGGMIDAGDWITSDLPLVIIDPGGKDVWLIPSADDWTSDLQLITVQITYDDPANNLKERPPLNQFYPIDKNPQKVRLLTVDPTKQVYGYEVTFYGAQTVRLSPSRSEDTIVRLRPGMRAHNVGLLRPDPAIFDDGTVESVVVKLSHAEAGLDEQTADAKFRKASDPPARFSYDFLKEPSYQCKVSYHFSNNVPLTRRITVHDFEDFVIPPPNPGA